MTQTVTNSSRAEVLRRIRAANGGASNAAGAHISWQGIPRAYTQAGSRDRNSVLQLLEDRLIDYDAHVSHTMSAGIAQSIAQTLAGRGARRIVIPAGLNPQWLPSGVDFVVDDGLTATTLDAFDGVLTAATLAIAETGSFVLQNVHGQGRRAITLVPDYHLCIIRAEDVVETVPEALRRLQPTAHLATTFVSGPSATADIEMTRIKGVHGPRSLDVILIA